MSDVAKIWSTLSTMITTGYPCTYTITNTKVFIKNIMTDQN